MIVLPSLRLRLPAPRFPPRYIVALQGVTQGGFNLELVSTFIYGVRGTSILLTSIYGIDDLGSFLVSVVGFTKVEFYEYVIYYGFPVRYHISSFFGESP